MEGFRDELNRFIESGSVHPSPTLDDLTEDPAERERTGTKISGTFSAKFNRQNSKIF